MSFKDWLFSSYPNPGVNGQWGLLHILTLVACIGLIVAISLIFRKKSDRSKKIILLTLVGLILIFELARRSINLIKTDDYGLNNILRILLPRPWCAISCWTLILAVIIRKKWLYNFASVTALLCALIFFAYPGVGFNNKYLLFENVYSIGTHALLLITSILLITLKFADFGDRKTILPVILYYIFTFGYAFLEIYVLKIENDPLYFMPGNDVQEILGFEYPWFLVVYIVFIIAYTSAFYLLGKKRKNKDS